MSLRLSQWYDSATGHMQPWLVVANCPSPRAECIASVRLLTFWDRGQIDTENLIHEPRQSGTTMVEYLTTHLLQNIDIRLPLLYYAQTAVLELQDASTGNFVSPDVTAHLLRNILHADASFEWMCHSSQYLIGNALTGKKVTKYLLEQYPSIQVDLIECSTPFIRQDLRCSLFNPGDNAYYDSHVSVDSSSGDPGVVIYPCQDDWWSSIRYCNTNDYQCFLTLVEAVHALGFFTPSYLDMRIHSGISPWCSAPEDAKTPCSNASSTERDLPLAASQTLSSTMPASLPLPLQGFVGVTKHTVDNLTKITSTRNQASNISDPSTTSIPIAATGFKEPIQPPVLAQSAVLQTNAVPQPDTHDQAPKPNKYGIVFSSLEKEPQHI